MRLKRPQILALLIAFLVLSLAAIAQEKTKAKTGEEMEIVGLGFEKKTGRGRNNQSHLNRQKIAPGRQWSGRENPV